MLPHVETVLRVADTHLIWSHRISEWCGHGPMLEEDIALANIGLDTLGQARLLLQHAATLENAGRDEDQLAYWRDDMAYRNFTLAELPRGDFAFTVMRNLAFAQYFVLLWEAALQSTDAQLAAIAEKAIKESRYHLTHARDWVIRLGDSTPEARTRIEAALEAVWPYTAEFFSADAVSEDSFARGIVPIAATALAARWVAAMTETFAIATLTTPADTAFLSHGKYGQHSEHLSRLLADMQSVARAHPGATW